MHAKIDLPSQNPEVFSFHQTKTCPMVLFVIMQHKMVLSVQSTEKILKINAPFQMNAIEPCGADHYNFRKPFKIFISPLLEIMVCREKTEKAIDN